MKPINNNPFIDKGIAIYFPSVDKPIASLLKLEILYSSENPLFDWINCNNSELVIWEKVEKISEEGNLFLYESSSNLPAGFYTIKATLLSQNQPRVGKLSVGLIKPTPYLIIGVPYSMYPPITLT